MSAPSTAAPESTRFAALRAMPSLALGVLVACQLMVVLDSTIVNVALPTIQRDLGFSATGLSWVQNAYVLAFGGMLLLGGRAGDILGRRRLFVWGIAVFSVASLLGGLATSPAWLVSCRAVQGFAAAFAAPGSLSLIATNFTEGEQRNRALGVFSTTAGLGMTIGMILGGLLTTVSWRLVMFINVPIGIAVVVLTPLVVTEPERHPGRFDLTGAICSVLALTSLSFAFINASEHGWDGDSIGYLAVAVALLAAFIVNELRVQQPIMPLNLFADRNRAGAFGSMVLVPAAMASLFYFLTQFVQEVRGYDALRAGFCFLPLAVVQFGSARTAPKLVPRFGPKVVSGTGMALVTIGLIWLSRLTANTGYLTGILGPLLLFGLGLGLCFMPLNMLALSGVERKDAGAVSGVLQTMQRIGSAVGLAVLVTAFGTAERDTHPQPGLSASARTHDLLAHGIASAFTVGCFFTVAGLLITAFVIKSKKAAS
jgi:EmrB/QacA subfamily drug resistance transporter